MGGYLSRSKEAFVFELGAEEKKLETREDVFEVCPDLESKDIVKICLSKNSYSEEACIAIAEVIHEHPNVDTVDFSDMFTGRTKSTVIPSIKILCSCLNPSTLKALDVSNNAFGRAGIESIVNLIQESYDLVELQVNSTGLDSKGTELIAQAIQHLRLRRLEISKNHIADQGAVKLSESLERLGTLRTVNVSSNRIHTIGMAAFFRAVAFNPKLTVINASDNNLKEPEAFLPMAESIELLKRLEEVNIGDCILRNEGALKLLAVLKRTNEYLRKLVLSYNELSSPEICLEIAELIKTRFELTTVELKGNEFKRKDREFLSVEVSDMNICMAFYSDGDEEFGEDEFSDGSIQN